jgi:WD40 repeat protein
MYTYSCISIGPNHSTNQITRMIPENFGGKIQCASIIVGNFFVNPVGRKAKIHSPNGSLHKIVTHPLPIVHMELHPKISTQFLVGTTNGDIFQWDVLNGSLIQKHHLGGPVDRFVVLSTDPPQVMSSHRKTLYFNAQSIPYDQPILSIIKTKEGFGVLTSIALHLLDHDGVSISTIPRNVKLKEEFTCVAYNAEWDLVAIGTTLTEVIILYASTRKPYASLTWHSTPLQSIAFSLDGNYLFTGAGEGVCVMWFLETLTKEFFLVNSPVAHIVCDPNISYCLVTLENNSVSIVDPKAKFTDLRLVECVPKKVQFDSKGRFVHLKNTIQLFDEKVKEIDQHNLNRLASRYSSDIVTLPTRELSHFVSHGDLMAASERYGNEFHIKIWHEMELVRMTQLHHAHEAPITSLDMMDGYMTSTSTDRTCRLWKRQDKDWFCTSILTYRNLIPKNARFSPDGSCLVILFESTLTIWSRNAEMIALIQFDSELRDVAFLGDLLVVRDPFAIHHVLMSTLQVIRKYDIITSQMISTPNHVYLLTPSQVWKMNELEVIPTKVKAKSIGVYRDIVWYLNEFDEVNPLGKVQTLAVSERVKTKTKETVHVVDPTPTVALEFASHDPLMGKSSWKSLFSGPAFTLSSTTSLYNSFMDTFLMKPILPIQVQQDDVVNPMEMNTSPIVFTSCEKLKNIF